MSSKPILITGGTGFLGSALVERLLQDKQALAVFGRSAAKINAKFGDRVEAVVSIDDLPDAGTFKAVVNLAGAGIFDQRWTQARKQTLRDSRIKLTEQLVAWIARSNQPLPVLVNGSAVGIYGDCGEEILTEESTGNPDFAQQLCADWEAAALQATSYGTRVCIVRTGLVLGQGGGILQRMLLPFRLGLGGHLGNGRQWMSWVHLQDWVTVVETMINNSEMQGAYNATAPNPQTNRQFSATLASVLKRPALLPLPEPVLRLLLGEMAALVLGSQRVIPQRLLTQGFVFQYPQLDSALSQILNVP